MTEFKPKSWKPLVIFLCIDFSVIAFCFLMIFSGRVTISVKGFAVDSGDDLYVGKEHCIEVYKDGQMIKIIPVKYTDYAFTIKNDRIILSANNYTYQLDLSGKEISKEKDTETYSELCRINSFEAENGDTYKKSTLFGYTKIIRNDNEAVYSMPAFDYCILILLVLAIGSFVIFISVFLIKNLIYWANNQ